MTELGQSFDQRSLGLSLHRRPPTGTLTCSHSLTLSCGYARAVQSVKDGNQAEALADFNKAVELAPDKPIHYRNRAAFFSLTKQWEKAIGDYGMVLKLEKDDPATLLSFHYYDPYQFTHQGAPWVAARYLTDVPYPALGRSLQDSSSTLLRVGITSDLQEDAWRGRLG